MLTGQPDRRFDFGFPGTFDRISKSLAKCKLDRRGHGTLARNAVIQ